jgi:hypothetical protein
MRGTWLFRREHCYDAAGPGEPMVDVTSPFIILLGALLVGWSRETWGKKLGAALQIVGYVYATIVLALTVGVVILATNGRRLFGLREADNAGGDPPFTSGA